MAVKLKKFSLYLMAAFYILGGLNHFINPEFYLPLIPPYFKYIEAINLLAGIFEVLFGVMILLPKSRYLGSIFIIFMLLAFIPSHVYFIEIGGCVTEGLCAPVWVGWVRLIIVHPVLIYWSWSIRNIK